MPKLPAFEDWRRPWTEGEIDEEKAAKLVYNLKLEVEKKDDKLTEKDAEIATLTSDLDTAKASKSGTDEDAQNEIKTLQAKVRDLEKTSGKARPEDQRTIDRLTVALKLGLSEADSKRLVGDTLEEIEADAKVFAAEHGIELPGSDDDGGYDADGSENEPPRRQPELDGRFRTGTTRVKASSFEDPSKVELPALR